nr:M1 family metallopeptidase [Flavobacteriales bacterium]
MRPLHALLLLAALLPATASAQLLQPHKGHTHADTLRGTNGPFRSWWDATHYDVTVQPHFAAKRIEGTTRISFRALENGQRMQVDLQPPLEIHSMTLATEGGETDVPFTREGNVAWVELPQPLQAGSRAALTIRYGGVPREARNPPWDGGWIWATDPAGNPWMSVACQGLGASVWYPCKDIQSDEPDSAALHIVVPEGTQGIGNGRLRSTVDNGNGTSTWTWAVASPINPYNLVPYIGGYAHFHEVFQGQAGPLDLDYWVLRDNEDRARAHFKQVPGMIQCFEDWFGPYPFYSDGYKLVEAPHLGMEHQSAVAYGNHYLNGYLGRDLSGSGWGLQWDFIIIHESAHEWFGNNITTADIADMWVHEGFTNYAEALYTGCRFGKAAGEDYVVGLRRNIRNDIPILGPYGVNQEGSGDMYYKGSNLVHTLRHSMDNDSLFKAMLREMNRRYRHSIVTS